MFKKYDLTGKLDHLSLRRFIQDLPTDNLIVSAGVAHIILDICDYAHINPCSGEVVLLYNCVICEKSVYMDSTLPYSSNIAYAASDDVVEKFRGTIDEFIKRYGIEVKDSVSDMHEEILNKLGADVVVDVNTEDQNALNEFSVADEYIERIKIKGMLSEAMKGMYEHFKECEGKWEPSTAGAYSSLSRIKIYFE